MRADEIPFYCDEEFYEALWLWDRTKQWGWAGGQGWGQEPISYVKAVMAIEDAHRAAEKARYDKMEKDRQSAGRGRK